VTFLARAGQAAGLLAEPASWAWALRAGQKVQQSYPSFAHYGMGFIEGHLGHRRRMGDDAATIEGYRRKLLATLNTNHQGLWARTPYQVRLHLDASAAS
jgi:hypothetical protein